MFSDSKTCSQIIEGMSLLKKRIALAFRRGYQSLFAAKKQEPKPKPTITQPASPVFPSTYLGCDYIPSPPVSAHRFASSSDSSSEDSLSEGGSPSPDQKVSPEFERWFELRKKDIAQKKAMKDIGLSPSQAYLHRLPEKGWLAQMALDHDNGQLPDQLRRKARAAQVL